jgi:hypothetical protein
MWPKSFTVPWVDIVEERKIALGLEKIARLQIRTNLLKFVVVSGFD